MTSEKVPSPFLATSLYSVKSKNKLYNASVYETDLKKNIKKKLI